MIDFPLRIGIDASWACGQLSGTGRFTLDLVESLVARDQRHTYYLYFRKCCRTSNPLYCIAGPNVVKVIVDAKSTIWRILFPLSRALKRDKVDVFISPAFFLPLYGSKKWVVSFFDLSVYTLAKEWARRDTRFGFVLMRLLFPRSIQKADHIVTISAATQNDLVRLFPSTIAKSSVIYPCFVASRFGSAQRNDGDSNPTDLGSSFFLFVGVASPRKNLERAIRAFGKFKEHDKNGFRFVVAGNQMGQYSNRVLKPLVLGLHLESWVEFHEYVSEADLARLYSAAHCLVYPSLCEGFGYPILEAMHFDVPVITSNISSCPEVGGDAAMYVNPYSETEIAQAMNTLTTNATLRRTLIARGKLRCEYFSRENLVSAYLRLLRGISEVQ